MIDAPAADEPGMFRTMLVSLESKLSRCTDLAATPPGVSAGVEEARRVYGEIKDWVADRRKAADEICRLSPGGGGQFLDAYVRPALHQVACCLKARRNGGLRELQESLYATRGEVAWWLAQLRR